MSGHDDVVLLRGEILKSLQVLERLEQFFRRYMDQQFKPAARKPEDAMVVVQSVANYYTCLETMFLRISQFFENNLDQARWHQDLLRKMTLRVDGVREQVLSEEAYQGLSELLKFRHFTRYYFEFDYDWQRLLYIKDRCLGGAPLVRSDMARFLEFLGRLAQEGEAGAT